MILKIAGLSASYTTRPWGVLGKKKVKQVLSGVSLEIGRGEILGLSGESGCGKSTLGKCILGLLNYEGQIIINGRVQPQKFSLVERRKRALQVQAVFQDPGAALNPVKTLGWILEEPLRAHKIETPSERIYKVDRMLNLVGLDSSYRKRKPGELSSGQKQRVSIGAAIMLSPELLVADEPVSALDVSAGAQILNLFRELNENLGLAMLFISHNLELLHYLCNRIALMGGGKIAGEINCANP